jgi:CBS domain containing-hemolysin-like protein
MGYLHVKDILDVIDDPAAAVPATRIRGLPEVPADARLDEALAALRSSRAHLARAVTAAGGIVGLVAMEDLVEAYVGTVRDSTHTPNGAA